MKISLENLTTNDLHRCIDCEYCDAANAICVINNKEYNLQDDDLWIYGNCEFYQEKFEGWSKNEEN